LTAKARCFNDGDLVEAIKFSRDHLWVRFDGLHARIGLCGHGQNALGEINAVELPEIGDVVERGEVFSELESRRTVAELLAPVSGTVTAINTDLEDTPSLVNDDPHHDGWLVEIDLADVEELEELLDLEQYEIHVGGEH
jgi:glycine cleavage system H protein